MADDEETTSIELTEMVRGLVQMREEFEPVLDAADGFKASLKARGWSSKNAESVAAEYLKRMIILTFVANA